MPANVPTSILLSGVNLADAHTTENERQLTEEAALRADEFTFTLLHFPHSKFLQLFKLSEFEKPVSRSKCLRQKFNDKSF